jgi:hypothetical protein
MKQHTRPWQAVVAYQQAQVQHMQERVPSQVRGWWPTWMLWGVAILGLIGGMLG